MTVFQEAAGKGGVRETAGQHPVTGKRGMRRRQPTADSDSNQGAAANGCGEHAPLPKVYADHHSHPQNPPNNVHHAIHTEATIPPPPASGLPHQGTPWPATCNPAHGRLKRQRTYSQPRW